MSDPRDRATASAPPILGQGCGQRYDPEALSPESGSDFPGAAELWQQVQPEAGEAPAAVPSTGAPSKRRGTGGEEA